MTEMDGERRVQYHKPIQSKTFVFLDAILSQNQIEPGIILGCGTY